MFCNNATERRCRFTVPFPYVLERWNGNKLKVKSEKWKVWNYYTIIYIVSIYIIIYIIYIIDIIDIK